VAQYPHNREAGGDAIANGFIYRGKLIPTLTDKLVFSDITTGRVWYANRADVLEADTARKVDTGALRTVRQRLPAPAADAARARAVTGEFGAVAPKFVQLTNEVVFDDLWRRPDLALRDRSLVTIAALAATGDVDQLELYVHRGLESGLTRSQITEALTHLGFYAGWSKTTKSLTAVRRTLDK
jgi:alkylhydroperoxidase/carboxymuconolactone decarboxylase family protein YurZ